MSEWRGQAAYSHQGYNPFHWRIVRHRLSTKDRIGRAISTPRIRFYDIRGRGHASTRAARRDTGWIVYRATVLTASCVGAAYGISEFVVAVFSK